MPTPTIPHLPKAPDLASQLPKTIVVTAKEVSYFAEACDAWTSGEYTDAEMQEEYEGISRSAACDWAIYGYTVQGQLNVEGIELQQTAYADSLRAYIEALLSIIHSQVEVSQRTEEAIEQLNKVPDPPPSFFKRLFTY